MIYAFPKDPHGFFDCWDDEHPRVLGVRLFSYDLVQFWNFLPDEKFLADGFTYSETKFLNEDFPFQRELAEYLEELETPAG